MINIVWKCQCPMDTFKFTSVFLQCKFKRKRLPRWDFFGNLQSGCYPQRQVELILCSKYIRKSTCSPQGIELYAVGGCCRKDFFLSAECLLRWIDTFSRHFMLFLQGRPLLWFSVYFHIVKTIYSSLKGKNLLFGSKVCSFRVDPCWQWKQTVWTALPPLQVCLFTLMHICQHAKGIKFSEASRLSLCSLSWI